jgi:hypothetical protein
MVKKLASIKMIKMKVWNAHETFRRRALFLIKFSNLADGEYPTQPQSATIQRTNSPSAFLELQVERKERE